MATTSTIERLDSLAAELATKLRMPSSSPTTSSSSSSPSSYFQIKEEVEKLHRTMVRIRALLIDAEEREIRENHIKLWLDELRDAAYDAEDVVEEFEYELLRYQLVCEEEEDDQATHEDRGVNRRSQVSDSHNKTPCRALHDALFQQQILDKIKEINKRLHEIHEDRYALKLRKKDGKSKKQKNEIERPPTSSVLGDSHVYGRDEDEDEVVDMLLSPQSLEHGTENVSVVSIIGMGGIGKTTLAQLVYNDGRVEKHFEMRQWVCVSDCFDVVKLTKDILEAITGKPTDLQVFNLLQEKLQGNLKGKRFLLVLDDLWNENWEQWESLWRPLSSGAEGSKVLVTTRNEEVSKISRAVRTHHLKVLPNSACWSLFARCAFGRKNPDDHPNLMSIGRQIVQKCGGIPLAIRTLGGLLSNETDEDNWNDILNSDIWELPEKKNYILPALKLSYHHLPSLIKPCFAVCAVFPKDYLFKREEMVFFWMAQGYITPRGRKSMEDVGLEYFDELLQRSFFHTNNDYGGHFKMHDLIHDLALSIWGNECLTVEDDKVPDSSRRARHVLFKREAGFSALVCRSTDKFRYLRTFYLPITGAYVLSTKLLDDMFQNMKYLRVLNLHGIFLSELPDSIGNLKHLRCLTTGLFSFRRLPESLCDLLNLQTLRVQVAFNLKELPKRLKVLVNLRHLYLPPNRSLSMTPRGIGRLTQLRTLTKFVVGEGIHAAGIGELKHLNDLQGELTIDIRSLNNWWVNREPYILSNTRGLEVLNLEWNDRFRNTFGAESGFTCTTQHEQQHEELLELIQPHTNIKGLHISGYIGYRLPKWMGDPSYLRLETISLSGFGNCTHLAALGQLPSLKSLDVSSMPAVRISDHEFFGSGMVVHGASPFPSLEVLSFSKLDILVEFYCVGTEEGGAFPRLQALKMANCDKLKYVELRHLSSLRTLSIFHCRKLTTLNYCYDIHASVSRSGSSSWLQRRAIHHMHIPRVHTMDILFCPKLDFLPVEPQLQLPSSLRRFSLDGSPLLREWVGRRVSKLVGVTNIFVGEYEVAEAWRPHLVLHNVEDVEEAEAADLRCMQKSTRWLELRWDLDRHRSSSSSSRPEEAAEQVLEELSPPPGSQLQELVIEGYQGRRFPNWVGHPGHLPNLRVLIIRNCPHLRTIQFQVLPEYGAPSRPSSSSSNSLSMTSLPLLKSLLIDDCPELVSLAGMRGTPSLRCLFLRRCPVLDFTHEAKLPPALQYAEITGCPLLSGWCQGDHIAHLRELRVDGELVFSDGTNVDAMREISKIENMIKYQEVVGKRTLSI